MVMGYRSLGHGKSWKSHGIPFPRFCGNPVCVVYSIVQHLLATKFQGFMRLRCRTGPQVIIYNLSFKWFHILWFCHFISTVQGDGHSVTSFHFFISLTSYHFPMCERSFYAWCLKEFFALLIKLTPAVWKWVLFQHFNGVQSFVLND